MYRQIHFKKKRLLHCLSVTVSLPCLDQMLCCFCLSVQSLSLIQTFSSCHVHTHTLTMTLLTVTHTHILVHVNHSLICHFSKIDLWYTIDSSLVQKTRSSAESEACLAVKGGFIIPTVREKIFQDIGFQWSEICFIQ